MISSLLSSILRCIHAQYAVLLVIFAVLSWRKSKNSLFVVLLLACVMATWRIVFVISSSRYCASFIVLSFFAFCYCYKNTEKNHNVILWLSFLVILTINLLETFTSFNNKYIYDLDETMTYNLKRTEDTSLVLLQEHEGRRLGRKSARVYTFDQLDDMMNLYSRYGHNILVYGNNIKKNTLEASEFYHNNKQLVSFCSSKNRKKHYSVFECYLPTNPYHDFKSSNSSKTNLINNGNFERLLGIEAAKKKLGKWIAPEDSFYHSVIDKIPIFKTLLPVWNDYIENVSPHTFADDENVISGKYSLNIKYYPNKQTTVYFLNSIKATSGLLCFHVKNLGKPGCIVLSRNDYIKGKQTTKPSRATYYISLSDNDLHTICINVEPNTFNGDSYLFHLTGKDINILIDDVSFFPL